MDILLDQRTTDISIVDGDIVLTTLNSELLRQRIAIRLNTWLGEWALNTQQGIPYRQTIFNGRIRNKEQLDALYLNQINSIEEINEIVDFESEYDRTRRTYTIIRLIVSTTEGTQVRVTESNPDGITYPAPPSTLTFICEI